MYTNCALYGILEQHPFTAFGENIALVVQCIVIVYLLWKFSSSSNAQQEQATKAKSVVSVQEKILVTLFVIAYVTSAISFLPDQYRYLLISSNVPILLYSRGIQVIETIRVQHTGAQSIVTLVMNLVGALIRIGTTIKEVGWDIAVLFSFILSLSLTSTMFIQYFYYRKNTELFVAKLKQQSDVVKKQQ